MSKFLRNQIIGLVWITLFILLATAVGALYEISNPAWGSSHVGVLENDGDGRRGVFVLWLLLVIIFTVINLITAARRRFKKLR